MPCLIPYIPERLHRNNRLTVNEFRVGEFIYRRCTEEQKLNPFATISLIDISVNREGLHDIFSMPDDALLNIYPDNGKGEKYLGYIVCEMVIRELTNDNFYYKEFEEIKEVAGTTIINRCFIRLMHKTEECNYAHCAFEIYFNNIEMSNQETYNANLNRNKFLRNWCRTELARMIIKEEITVVDTIE